MNSIEEKLKTLDYLKMLVTKLQEAVRNAQEQSGACMEQLESSGRWTDAQLSFFREKHFRAFLTFNQGAEKDCERIISFLENKIHTLEAHKQAL